MAFGGTQCGTHGDALHYRSAAHFAGLTQRFAGFVTGAFRTPASRT
jgi:hypothetical protein